MESGGRWRHFVLAFGAFSALVLAVGTALVVRQVLEERDGLDCIGERMGVIAIDGTGRDGARSPEDALLGTEWWGTLGLPTEGRVITDEPHPELGITVADDEVADAHERGGGRVYLVHIDGRAQVRISVERGMDDTYAISGVSTCYKPIRLGADG